jgi:hypothetical protein
VRVDSLDVGSVGLGQSSGIVFVGKSVMSYGSSSVVIQTEAIAAGDTTVSVG